MFKILRAMFNYLSNGKGTDKDIEYIGFILMGLFGGGMLLELLMSSTTGPAYIYGVNLSNVFDKDIVSRSASHLVLLVFSFFGSLIVSIVLAVLTDILRDNLKLNKCPIFLAIPSCVVLLVACLAVFGLRAIKSGVSFVYSIATIKESVNRDREISKTKTIS